MTDKVSEAQVVAEAARVDIAHDIATLQDSIVR